MISLGEKIRQLRQKRGLTLKGLSMYSGVPVSSIATIESGNTPNPSLKAVVRISIAFNVSIYDLLE